MIKSRSVRVIPRFVCAGVKIKPGLTMGHVVYRFEALHI